MIVIEGMDNTGKTTLALWLQGKIRNCQLVHGGGPVRAGTQAERLMALQMASSYPRPLILDRVCLISEAVYGPLLRNVDSFSGFNQELLWSWFLEMKPLIIYCRPSLLTIKSNMDERPQMEGVSVNSDVLLNAYDQVMANISHRGFAIAYYDYKAADITQLWDSVRDYLNGRGISWK